MAVDQLSIKIGADAGAAIAEFKKFNGYVKVSEANIKSFGSSQITRGFDNVGKSAGGAAKGIEGVGSAVGRSNQRMVEFGRVIQDLPFGFAGIANNLTQIIPAVGGLGLAFSAVISAITFAQVGLTYWSKGLGNASKSAESHAKAIQEAKKALEEYRLSLDDISRIKLTGAQDAQQELGALKTLYDASQNVNLSYKQRKEAVDLLQERYPAYFKNLSDETILAGKAKGQYDKLTKSIIAASTARAAQKELDTIAEELRVVEHQRKEIEKTTDVAAKAYQERKEKNEKAMAQARKMGQSTIAMENGIAQKAQEYVDIRNKQLLPAIKRENDLLSRQKKISEEIQGLIKEQGVKILKTETETKIKEPKVEKPDFSYFEKYLSFDPTKVKEKTKEFAEAFDLFAQFALKNREIFVGLDEILKIDSKKNAIIEAAKWWKDYENGIYQLKPQRIEIEGPQINTSIDQIAGPGRELKAPQLPRIDTSEIQAQYKELETMIQGFNTSLAVSVGEGIGDAIATGDFSNIFKGIASVIGSFIQELGKYLIKASIAKEAFDKAIAVLLSVTGGGAVGLAAGIALVAVGGAIKSNIPKFKGFAKGGFVPGQGSGDTVPAMLTPGEYVVRKQDVPLFMSIIKLLEGNKIGSSIKDISGRMGFADGGFVPSVRSVSQQRNGNIGNITIKQPAVIILNQRQRGRDTYLQQAREAASQRRTH